MAIFSINPVDGSALINPVDGSALAAYGRRRAVEQREVDLAGGLVTHVLAQHLLAPRPVTRPLDPLQQLLRACVQVLSLADKPVAERSLIHCHTFLRSPLVAGQPDGSW
jgi:hypothetical protein